MKKSAMFGFSLEADDRREEDNLRQRSLNQTGMASVLGLGQEVPEAVMDTDHQEKMEEPKDQLRYNLNFDKWATINCCSLLGVHYQACSRQGTDGFAS